MPSVDNTIQLIQLGKQGVASVCDPALSEDPWNFDQRLGYGPGASEWDRIPASAPRQGALPGLAHPRCEAGTGRTRGSAGALLPTR
jgi:quinolinate synthase